jgi:hypothetical protein
MAYFDARFDSYGILMLGQGAEQILHRRMNDQALTA